MNTLLTEYQERFRGLVKQLGDKTPRELRLFDIRLRLAIDLFQKQSQQKKEMRK